MKYKLKYEYKNKYREKLMLLAKKRHMDVVKFFIGARIDQLFKSTMLKRNTLSCDANVCQAFIVRCTKKFMRWPSLIDVSSIDINVLFDYHKLKM